MGLTSGSNNTTHLTTLPATSLPTSSISSSVPCFFSGQLFASQLAACTARLLTELGLSFNYRRHRVLMTSTGQPEFMGDFWLPNINTFLSVYADTPLVEQGRIHTEVAKLGHNVVILVGEVASPVRQCNSDPKNGWRGWRLEAFSGAMTPGWTTFLDVTDEGSPNAPHKGICLANMSCPYDARACTPRLLDLYASVVSPPEVDTPSTTPLNKTLGKDPEKK